MCAFNDTENKATIRQKWDYQILEFYRDNFKKGQPLTYFGMPGPDIHDLLDWRGLLSPYRTGVESPGRTKSEHELADQTIGRLNTNVMVRGVSFSSGFQLLRADVEDVIMNGVDAHGVPPQLNDGRPSPVSHFGYDLVNLDFDGGLGYRNKHGDVKRVAALKRLFERQYGHDFLLLLTINVRHNLGNEIEEYLSGLHGCYPDQEWRYVIDWYLARSDGELEYKLKAAVPSFIRAVAEPQMFKCLCRPPIFYEGHQKARMLHFVFQCETQKGTMKAFSQQNDRDLIELPLIRCESGELKRADLQHPGMDPQRAAPYLDALSDELRTLLLN